MLKRGNPLENHNRSYIQQNKKARLALVLGDHLCLVACLFAEPFTP
jgi:hypothetical protein